MSCAKWRTEWNFITLNPIPSSRAAMFLSKYRRNRCFSFSRFTCVRFMLPRVRYASHWSSVSTSIAQSEIFPSCLIPFKVAFLSRTLPSSLCSNADITKSTPVYSFAMSFPLWIPLANFVLGLSLSDCRDSSFPILRDSVLTRSAVLEVLPICLKKQSRVYMNMPSRIACNISTGQAPCTPLLLCNPNLSPWKAFCTPICDSSLSLLLLLASYSCLSMCSSLYP